MLFLLSPEGRGMAPLIELSVVNRIFVLLLLLLRLHVLGANESHPVGGNSNAEPAPVYDTGLTRGSVIEQERALLVVFIWVRYATPRRAMFTEAQ